MTGDKNDILRTLRAALEETDGEIGYWGDPIALPAPVPGKSRAAHPSEKRISGFRSSETDVRYSAIPKPATAGSEDAGLDPVLRDGAISKADRLARLRDKVIGDCHRCPLGDTRVKLVFGVGNPDAPVMFVGEGPGFDEDRKGEPFVGKAGQLLDKIIAAIGLDRTSVYIANVVKCHPMINPNRSEMRGNDRPPNPREMDTCLPFLREQIAIIQPRIIVTLGAVSSRALLNTHEGITRLRGNLRPVPVVKGMDPIPVLPTYHPAALLRDETLKRPVWEDMKVLRKFLDTARGSGHSAD